MKCQRCSKEAHFQEKCGYCEKNVCRACEKSTRNATNSAGRKVRRIICKTCWGVLPSRKAYLHD